MIEKEGNEWKLCKYKVIHESHGNEQTHYTNDRDYWRNTVAKHDHLTDLEFEEMDFTSEQKERLEELNQMDISEAYMSVARDMVREGIIADDPVAESRIRAAIQAVEEDQKKLETVEKKYRDKVQNRLE